MAETGDPRFERLLREGLRTQRPDAGECPGSDALAAWREGALSRAERERCDAHFAACPRCRAELAAIARMEGAMPEVRPESRAARGWRWPSFSVARWMAPVAAGAAAVLALSVALRLAPDGVTPGPELRRVAAPPKAGGREEAGTSSRSSTQAEDPGGAAAGAAAVEGLEDERLKKEKAEDAGARADAAPAPVPAAPPAPALSEEAAGAKAIEGKVGQLARPHPTTPTQEAAPALAAPERDASSSFHDARPAAQAPAPAEDPVAGGRRSPSGFLANEGQDRAVSRDRLEREEFDRQVVVATPSGAVLWRIGDAGAIERSEDAGRSWQRVESPTSHDLLAGTCAADEVCWIVGRHGIVLRTTDGTRFAVVAAPTAEDLAHVTARDAASATIATIDGDELRTDDGGLTWRPVSTGSGPE